MSGIYIPGMEIPTDSTVIAIHKIGGKLYATRCLADKLYPLVPVPPHGRLGDLDDFAKRMKNLVEKAENDGFDLGTAWYSAFVRHIELTPTIILADKEGDG